MAAGPIGSEAVRRTWPVIEGIPVFLYHEIADEGQSASRSPNRKYVVVLRQFRDQLSEIRNGGYQITSVRQVAQRAYSDSFAISYRKSGMAVTKSLP